MRHFLLLFALMVIGVIGWLRPAAAQDLSGCPDALAPRLMIGEMGRVTPGDANKVRDIASTAGTLIGSVPGEGIFTVLDGPVCADGYIWWQVDYQDLIGWTVEGGGGDYWLEPYTPPATATPIPPTATPTPLPTALPAVGFNPPRPFINQLAEGVQARVIDDAPDGTRFALTIRSAPSRNADPAGELTAGDIVTIVSDEQIDAESYFWREIETADGERGWVVEGFYQADSDRYDRTLLAACPTTENRIAFFFGRYLYTANEDGSEACIFDRLLLPDIYTTYFGLAYFPNTFLRSPDGSEFLYIDFPTRPDGNQDLYAISADGLTRRRLTEGSNLLWADWSTDGERILFTRTLDGQGNAQVWTMRADGTALSALTEDNTRKEWAAWLDNERLVYVENIGKAQSQMGPTAQEYIFYTVSVTEGGQREIFRTNLDVLEPKVSPDGTTLLVQGWEFKAIEGSPQGFGEYNGFQTLLLNLESAEITPIESDTYDLYDMDWLPDGSAVFTYDGAEIIRYTLASGEFTRLEMSRPVYGRGFTYHMGWLDNSRMVILSDAETIDMNDDELVSVDILTGEVTILIGAAGD